MQKIREKEVKMSETIETEMVDILLASYNTNIHFLKIQIDSILNQTYTNIHLIISDDASTKKEVKKVLQEYSKKDKRIELYIQRKNLGYLKNFEFLLTKSKANYIMFSDHDDVWYANKVKKSMETLKQKKVDLVYTDAEQIDEKGILLHKSYLRYKHMPIIEGKDTILAFSRHIAIGCSQLFTKKIKEQMLPFSEQMMAHDWISVYLASKENGIACIDEPLFGYRLHNSNVFGGRNLKQNLSRWKQENGKRYQAYIQYRDKAITEAYLNGAQMCETYNQRLGRKLNTSEQKVLQYYRTIQKTKWINLHIGTYKKFLGFDNMKARFWKEMMMFHFPIISYLVYVIH